MRTRNSIELRQLILDIGVSNENHIEIAGIVAAAELTARVLWLHRLDEDDRTEELRRQLLHLETYGLFDYD